MQIILEIILQDFFSHISKLVKKFAVKQYIFTRHVCEVAEVKYLARARVGVAGQR